MKKEATSKLYLEARKPEDRTNTDFTVFLPAGVYQQLARLAHRTDRSLRELGAILLRYALDNTIVESTSDDEEDNENW